MRDHESHARQAVSRRDVAAAWICCVLAIVAGALMVAGPMDVSQRDAYVGAYLPGRDVIGSLDRRDDDFDDDVEWAVAPPDLTQPLLCSAQENRPQMTVPTLPHSTVPALKC